MNEHIQQFLDQGRQSLQSGQMNQAIEHANQAILLDPGCAEAHLIRAIGLSQTKQPDAATEAFQETLRLDPSNGKAHYNLGVHQYGLGRRDLALDACRKAVEFEPGLASARELLNRIEQEMGLGPSYPQAPQAPQGSQGPSVGQQYSEYHRGTPYAPGQPIHAIAFIEKMGDTKWRMLGLVFTALRGVYFILSIQTAVRVIQAVLANPNNPPATTDPGQLILSLVGWGLWFLLTLWVLLDLADKRTKWIWALPYFILCCCGLEFAVSGIYIGMGRDK